VKKVASNRLLDAISFASALFSKRNFVLEREIDAGEHHYGMILINKNI